MISSTPLPSTRSISMLTMSQDVNDDELELDVDEIPDPVLQDLYKFVKAHRDNIGADHGEEDDEYEESSFLQVPSVPSGRKKNKPMTAREQEDKINQIHKQLQAFSKAEGKDSFFFFLKYRSD
jgi:bromodomain-containing factor 1